MPWIESDVATYESLLRNSKFLMISQYHDDVVTSKCSIVDQL